MRQEHYFKEAEKHMLELTSKDSSGHDIFHAKRVFNLVMRMRKEDGGDRLVLGLAALLHDTHRIIQNRTKKYCSPKKSLPTIKKFLSKLKLPADKISRILHCIEFHEEYGFAKGGKTVSDIEALILQDADNLDAMGALGIARALLYSGAHGQAAWDPRKPVIKRPYDDAMLVDASAIHHFYNKLLRLKNNMNTATAKKIAEKRHKFMESYLQEFFDEWEGKA